MIVTIIVLIGAIIFFVNKYKTQRKDGVSFDDVDLFGTTKEHIEQK